MRMPSDLAGCYREIANLRYDLQELQKANAILKDSIENLKKHSEQNNKIMNRLPETAREKRLRFKNEKSIRSK